MGVALPDEARADIGLTGDWKTVKTVVVGEVNEVGDFKAAGLNKGIHKRKIDEEEEEREADGETITKRKGWGHTYKSFPGSKGAEDDIESLLKKKVPQRDPLEDAKPEDSLKKEEPQEEETSRTLQDIPTAEEAEAQAAEAAVKRHEDSPSTPVVVFKKRKKVAK